jgi:predicted RNA-binding protein YlxR (DUF448 family)
MRTKNIKAASRPGKHVAQRTCLGCRQVKDKRELVRLVRTPEGEIEVDATGKKAGRGAYLCPNRNCWEAGLKGNRLDYVLRTNVSRESREKLRKYAEEKLSGVASGTGK